MTKVDLGSLRRAIAPFRFIQLFLFICLMSPLFFLIFVLSKFNFKIPGDLVSVALNSFVQASASAMLSCALGLCGALGLLSIKDKSRRNLAEIFVLFPTFLPSLFFLLALLSVVPLQSFLTSFGLSRLVLAHVMLNCGLASCLLATRLEKKLGPHAELALMEGASRLLFLRATRPLIIVDIISVFALIFFFCLTSFSIPLVLTQGQTLSLEIYLYERILVDGRWSEASVIALLQMCFLVPLFFLVKDRTYSSRARSHRNLKIISWDLGLIPPALLSAGIWVGCLLLVSESMWTFRNKETNFIYNNLTLFGDSVGEGLKPFFGSLMIFLLTSLIVSVGLCVLLYSQPSAGIKKALYFLSFPSAVVTGFFFLWLPGAGPFLELIKISMALSLLFFGIAARWVLPLWDELLQDQTKQARVLGAQANLIFWTLTLPQALPLMVRSSSWIGFWAIGDFAVSRIIARNDWSLALKAHTLMSSYRINEAGMVALFCIPVAITGLFILKGIELVLHREALSRLR